MGIWMLKFVAAKLTKSFKMKTFCTSIFMLFCISMIGQDSSKVVSEINQEIWEPFIEAFGNFDTDAFLFIHSDSLIRINKDGKQIRDRATYEKNQRKWNQKRNGDRAISFSFISRFYGNNLGFEKGYYKVKYTRVDQEIQYSYGMFEVVLRKEKGTWKILIDSDEHVEIDESIFQKGEIVE
jgi:ketosteroid isomerase-like protein